MKQQIKTSQRILSLLLVGFCSLGFNLHEAGAKEDSVDLDGLFETCTNDWSQYGRRLNELGNSLAKETKDMGKEQYKDRFIADDPVIFLIQVTWPKSLRGRDEFWKSHLACANLHLKARQALDSSVVKREAKKEAIEAFSDCVFDKYTRGRTMAPFDRMLRCYNAQASK